MNNFKQIKNEYLTATISLLGAELKSLKDESRDYIWCSDPKFWKRSAPFLFPVVGTLKDKKTIINGKTYNIGQHGLLRDQLFDVYEEKEDEITFVNSYNEDTLKIYPFEYKAFVTYKLTGKNLLTTVKIVNNSNEKMPFNIGGHPAFNCPMFEGDKFTDYKIVFEKEENILSPKVESNATLNFGEIVFKKENVKELQLEKSLFDIDTIIVTKIKSQSVQLLNNEEKGIKFSFPGFSTFAIWTPYNEAPFVCLEPWNGYNDHHDTNGVFVEKDDIIKLEKDSEYEVSYNIEILA